MTKPTKSRILYAATTLFMSIALLMPASALANMDCNRYYHTHNWGPHTYLTHNVYSTTGSGTGEWTYWHEDYYNFGLIYENQYYGTKYCA